MIRLIVFILLAAPKARQEPIKNPSFESLETNPKTGRMEVVSIIKGDEAVLIDATPDKEIVDVRKVHAKYFTEPKKQGDRSEMIEIWSDRGRLDRPAGSLDLKDNVRVERPDRTVLTAPAAVVRFTKKYICPGNCPVEAAAPGKCSQCRQPLGTKTVTTLEAEKDVQLTKPGILLLGDDLHANDEIKLLTVGRKGFLEILGRPSDALPQPGAPPRLPKDVVTRLSSDGPLSINELDENRWRITARENVHLKNKDATGREMQVDADETDIEAVRRFNPLLNEPKMTAEKASARGHVGVVLEDGNGRVSAETLDYVTKKMFVPGMVGEPAATLLENAGAFDYPLADLTGSPVVTQQDKTVVRSKSVRMEPLKGFCLFRDEVTADLAPSTDPNARPLKLASRRLTTEAEVAGKKWNLRRMEALEDVVLSGFSQDPQGGDPGSASADRFVWDMIDQRGLLEKTPFVRATMGASIILAPKIVMEGQSVMILKGPKRIKLVSPEKDGRKMEMNATCEGDAEFRFATAAQPGRVLLFDRSSVRTPEFHMTAERIEAFMAAGNNQGVEALNAFGRVRAQRLREGGTIYGDRLRYDPTAQELIVTGAPYAVADSSRQDAVHEEIVYNEKDKSTLMRSKTGRRGMIRIYSNAR